MSHRIPCCVPFCRRTANGQKFPDAHEIICGKHYRLASLVLRRRLSKLRRRHARYREGVDDAKIERSYALDWRIWDRIKAQVIERAAGIS